MVGIVYANYYLPKQSVSLEEILINAVSTRLEREAIFQELKVEGGIDYVMAGSNMDLKLLFLALVEQFLEETGINPEDVMFISYTNPAVLLSRDGINIPYLIKEQYKMRNASVFVLDQDCASTVYTSGLLSYYLDKHQGKYALILSANIVNSLAERYVGFTAVGDACGIMALGSKPAEFYIVDFNARSNGEYSYFEYLGKTNRLSGINLIKHAVRTIHELVERNNIQIPEIACLIPPSTSISHYSLFSQILDMSVEKIFLDNVSKGGHLGDVDTIRNLHDCNNANRLRSGDFVLLHASGSKGTNDIVHTNMLLKKV